MKIGIISARMHLLQALRNHRELFSKGVASVSTKDCQHVNNEIGLAIKKLTRFGVKGKCNKERYLNSSVIVKSLFVKHKRNKC